MSFLSSVYLLIRLSLVSLLEFVVREGIEIHIFELILFYNLYTYVCDIKNYTSEIAVCFLYKGDFQGQIVGMKNFIFV